MISWYSQRCAMHTFLIGMRSIFSTVYWMELFSLFWDRYCFGWGELLTQLKFIYEAVLICNILTSFLWTPQDVQRKLFQKSKDYIYFSQLIMWYISSYTMTFSLHQGGVVMSRQITHTHSHQDTPLSPYAWHLSLDFH